MQVAPESADEGQHRRLSRRQAAGQGDSRERSAETLWAQFGVINLEAASIAEQGGVTVIMDRCIKVEHARYVGRMNWLGFNTDQITALRGGLQ